MRVRGWRTGAPTTARLAARLTTRLTARCSLGGQCARTPQATVDDRHSEGAGRTGKGRLLAGLGHRPQLPQLR